MGRVAKHKRKRTSERIEYVFKCMPLWISVFNEVITMGKWKNTPMEVTYEIWIYKLGAEMDSSPWIWTPAADCDRKNQSIRIVQTSTLVWLRKEAMCCNKIVSTIFNSLYPSNSLCFISTCSTHHYCKILLLSYIATYKISFRTVLSLYKGPLTRKFFILSTAAMLRKTTIEETYSCSTYA